MRIKKNDQVYVLAGKHKGKTGRVLFVIPGKDRLVVEGVNLIKKHTKPNPQRNIKGGIVEKEAPIHISNVSIMSKDGKTHGRIGVQVLPNGQKVRICRKDGSALE